MKPPVFLLSSERSGTNLLRRRFTEYQKEYYGPAPLHLLKHLYWAEPYYGNLASDKSFEAFVGSALGLAYHHFSPWDEVITVDQVRSEYESLFRNVRSAIGVMHVIYSIYANRKGYSGYFCKDNNLFDYTSDIKLLIPGAKFIYLYRDPRDVVVSQLKRPLQNKSVSFLASLWRDEQVKCIRHAKSLESSNDILLMSYESLIADEEANIQRLCDFLNIKKLAERSKISGEEKTEIQEWVNLDGPTMKDNSGMFYGSLKETKVRKIEGICWHQMLWLKYEPISECRPVISSGKIELDTLVGKIFKLLISRVTRKGITAEQMDRAKYTKSLQARWK